MSGESIYECPVCGARRDLESDGFCGSRCRKFNRMEQERDEALAEVERLRESLEWSEACRKARLSMAETCLNGRAEGKSPCGACSICCGDLKAAIAHLRRGIEAYRMKKDCSHRSDHCFPTCASCAWEREERTQRHEKV